MQNSNSKLYYNILLPLPGRYRCTYFAIRKAFRLLIRLNETNLIKKILWNLEHIKSGNKKISEGLNGIEENDE